MNQITQAEITEFARLKKVSETASKELEASRKALVERHIAGATQEDGPFKLTVEVTPINTPSYKAVVEAIKDLNAMYTNGGGKPHLLNEKIPKLVEDAIEPGKTRTTVKVEANV